MWLIAAFEGPTLLGVAAIVSAIGGIASTIMALRKSTDEQHVHALEQLAATRAESERLAAELHALKLEASGEGQLRPSGRGS
ncbi:MAG TPA: hypothetical protein VIS51_04290 [Solirubrobacterales bacterium]